MAVLDPITTTILIVTFSIFFMSVILNLMKTPSVITYIIAGVVIGAHGFGLITDPTIITALGSLGIILLLFFIGLELSVPNLVKNWKIALGGGILQVILSLIIVGIFGYFLDWSLGRIVLIAFVITQSSTAIILKLLQYTKELNTKVGESVISVLIVQDLLVIPLIIILGFFGGTAPNTSLVISQIIGATAIILLLAFVIKKGRIAIPLIKKMKTDIELQVFIALSICFGFAYFTGLLGLSTALGAFAAGILVSYARETEWVYKSLHPFYVVFVALFFVSVGLLIDINFILENFRVILFLVFVAFFVNIVINASALRYLGLSWKESIYSGVILSQIGEFSFLMAAIGFQIGVVGDHGYNLILSTISITLLLSAPLIIITRRLLKCSPSEN